MIETGEIKQAVRAYLDRYPDEATRVAALTAALTRAGDPTSRRTFTGHVTCSALILDPAGRVLYIRHRTLGRWLCPGGHLEADDRTLAAAAAREAIEETGIGADALTLADEVPLDIDVHTIPANPGRDEPEHQHFDLLYVFTTVGTPQVVPQAEEVCDVAWLPATEVEPAALREKITPVVARRAVSAGPPSS